MNTLSTTFACRTMASFSGSAMSREGEEVRALARCKDGSKSGYLSLLRFRTDGLPRWALCRPSGSVVTAFEAGITQDDVRRILAKGGLILQDDSRVVPAELRSGPDVETILSRLLATSDHAQAGEKQLRNSGTHW
jgi:hypothetical protein